MIEGGSDSEDMFEEMGKGTSKSETEEEKHCRLHNEEFDASDGFDIEHFPLTPCLGQSIPVLLDPKDAGGKELEEIAEYYKKYCELSLDLAIKREEETKGRRLKLVRIIMSFRQSAILFYTTFEAEDLDTGEIKVCQTEVFFDVVSKKIEVEVFRTKPEKQPEKEEIKS